MTLANLDRQFSPRLDVLDIADALDPLSRAVIDNPAIDLPALRDCLAATEACAAKSFDANKWQKNAMGLFCFARPNDTLRLDRTDTGYVPTIGALKHFDAVAYRFGLTAAQTRHLFDWPEEIEGRGYTARRIFLENLDQFICDHESIVIGRGMPSRDGPS